MEAKGPAVPSVPVAPPTVAVLSTPVALPRDSLPRDSLPRDWDGLLRDFLSNDARAAAAAADAFCGVVQGALRAVGAYERRSSWEDLMHDVLLALFEHGHDVQKPAAWLRRATLNAYLDVLRRDASQAARVRGLGHVQSMLGRGESEAHLDASVVLRQELEELRDAVARLPEGMRRIVDSVYPRDPRREPGTLADVARSLGLELHTLKNGLRGAIERLGRELRRERNLRRFRIPERTATSTQRPRPPRSKARFRLLRATDPMPEREPRLEE